jgi:hypothetical protein
MIILSIIIWILLSLGILGGIITLVEAIRDWWRGDKFDGGSIMPFH